MSVTTVEPLRQGAAEYLRSIPLLTRRLAGQVYTPRHLIEFILNLAVYPPRGVARGRTLLDPACGAGAFLEVATELLARGLARRGLDLSKPAGRIKLLQALEATLYGVDIDPEAVKLARDAVRAVAARLCGSEPPDGFFEGNVVCADFLTDPAVRNLPPIGQGGFHYIVGNPPYVSAVRIDPCYKDQLRAQFVTARGRMDLYTLFMERGVELLAPKGHLAFITPDKFLMSQTSEPLRRLLLSKGAVRVVARFRSHKVFREAATVPCVTVYERGGGSRPVSLLECSERPDRDGRVQIGRRSNVKAAVLGATGGWSLTAPALERLAESIQGAHPPLKLFLSRLSAGIATGRDSIYVFGAGEASSVEEELVRPAIRGRDILPFRITDPDLGILVPYTFGPHGEPHLVDLGRYPRARKYLESHREALEDRHCVRVWEKAWYDVHDPMPFDLGNLPKILVPDVASHSRFAFDEGRYWPLHSVYYLLPGDVDPMFLTAVLNSMPIEFLMRLRAPVVKDGFSRYRKQFLEVLPVPQVTTRQQTAIVKAVETADYVAVDELIVRLFGLSAQNMRVARRFLDVSRRAAYNSAAPHDRQSRA